MISKFKISNVENRIYFSVSENGFYNVTVRNQNDRLIFERFHWNLESNIEYFIVTTYDIDSPEFIINKSIPVVLSRIDYSQNKIFIRCEGDDELNFKLYDCNGNKLLSTGKFTFNNNEIWHSPSNQLNTIGHVILFIEDKYGQTIHTNNFKPDYIFCHIPKTGGTSIKKVLGIKTGHSVFDKTKSDKFSFTFVRNPYNRFLSAYFYLKEGGLGHQDKLDKEKYIGDSDLDDFIKNKLRNSINQQHFRPQSDYIPNGVDFIGKIENMQEDFDRLCEIIGVNKIELPCENKTSDYSRYHLTEEQKEIVYDVYKHDFDKFGYDR